MPKTLTAQTVRIGSLTFSVDSQGNLIALEVTAEVNYGEMGRSVRRDILPALTPSQKAAAQTLYNKIGSLLEAEFLA